VRVVRAARKDAIENDAQEAFIGAFGRAWRESPSPGPALSRYTGCLLGGAVGDALGYPVEFLRSKGEIEGVLGQAAPERLPHTRGRPAVVSDDTQMTLFTAEGLLRALHGGKDVARTAEYVLRAYQRWLATQGTGKERWVTSPERGWLLDVPELHDRRAPGNTCMSALTQSLSAKGCPRW
jgi:hypothetical protein